MPLPLETTPVDVKKRVDAGEKLHLIDVREAFEHATASIDGAELIPMNTVPHRLPELEAKADEAPLVVFCHHGMRSLNVVDWLRRQGVEECQSMSGGIDRWSMEVDPKVPRY
ncbi:MAG: rhodanese-like domain-containing protein [Bryobacteraceae bacterium]|nr:rhodanese-like domain-containing protein [Bryobacteraceae bacterium]